MTFFVTGALGQLGSDVVDELIKRRFDVVGSDIISTYKKEMDSYFKYKRLDITNMVEVARVLGEIKPDVVIHCAAWTAVDLAEEEKYKKNCFDINFKGTANIAYVAKNLGCKMVYVSTDYVFNGSGVLPWKTDSDNLEPVNYYGLSKLEGEKIVSDVVEKCFIVRTSWLFGKNGNNFVSTILKEAKKEIKKTGSFKIKIVSDQIGTPTYSVDLATFLVDLSLSEKFGFYHATNEGDFISWYDFALEIYKQYSIMGCQGCWLDKVKVLPVLSNEYTASKAKRPLNSRLDKSKLVENGFKPLPDWKDALHRYLKELDF